MFHAGERSDRLRQTPSGGRGFASLASAEARDGDPFEAVVLLAAAAACFEGDHPMSTPTTVDVAGLARDLRARLGEQEWATAAAQGREDADTCVRSLVTD